MIIKQPVFFCVGAQKAGTTTLHNILKEHPLLCLPKKKETKFFFDDGEYKKGKDYYIKNYFKGCNNNKKILGEVDPEYMYFPKVPKRIFETLGSEVKIIFLLRNPAYRAYSHYNMSYVRGHETFPFKEAIRIEKKRIEINESLKNHLSYIDRGYYSLQIQEYLKYFKKENMFFMIFEEDIIKNQDLSINKLFNFLEVDEVSLNRNKKSNESFNYKSKFLRDLRYRPNNIIRLIAKILFPNLKMRNKLRNYIEQFNQIPEKRDELSPDLVRNINNKYFLNDIRELEKIIDRNLDVWLS